MCGRERRQHAKNLFTVLCCYSVLTTVHAHSYTLNIKTKRETALVSIKDRGVAVRYNKTYVTTLFAVS